MGDYDSFESACPACGSQGTLIVLRVTLVVTGDEVQTAAELHSDGFDITPSLDEQQLQLKDLSTQDEEVECSGCHEHFTLDELLLEGQQNHVVDVWASVGAREMVRAGSPRIACMKARRSFEHRPLYDCNIADVRTEVVSSSERSG
jgi:uncharacterized Zn-finger protein